MRSRVEVGDLVRVQRDGRSAAARKYAGRKGRVTMRGLGLDGTVIDVRLSENNFDTVSEEQDLSKTLRASANRRVANVSTAGQEAIQSFGEPSSAKSCQPIGGASKCLLGPGPFFLAASNLL